MPSEGEAAIERTYAHLCYNSVAQNFKGKDVSGKCSAIRFFSFSHDDT